MSTIWPILSVFFQNDNDLMEQEIDIATLASERGQEAVNASDFELLKVLGQGSFGKVSPNTRWESTSPPDGRRRY